VQPEDLAALVVPGEVLVPEDPAGVPELEPLDPTDPLVGVEVPVDSPPVAATVPLGAAEPDMSTVPVAAIVPPDPGEPVAPEASPLVPDAAPLDAPEPVPASTGTL
jgi:hypothetical protein